MYRVNVFDELFLFETVQNTLLYNCITYNIKISLNWRIKMTESSYLQCVFLLFAYCFSSLNKWLLKSLFDFSSWKTINTPPPNSHKIGLHVYILGVIFYILDVLRQCETHIFFTTNEYTLGYPSELVRPFYIK